ncbi:MAG: hypothetical protein Q9227_001342 [Pyrenula ochraceoflavens]
MSDLEKRIRAALPSTCKITVPEPKSHIHDIISRWSDAGVSLPAAVVVPSTENDILSIIKFALENGLQVVPTSGGHGSFVPIGHRTIYVDLKEFRKVTVNKAEQSVTIQGGALTGDVLRACAGEGLYTCMVGAFLGGGSGALNGLNGFAVDHVFSIRLLTASGKVLTVTPSSIGTEKLLFNTLRGGGLGLGVVTAITLKTFPLSSLNLDGGKFWQRKLVFKPEDIRLAAETWASLNPAPAPLTALLAFAKTPIHSPAKGAVMIMVIVGYYGPTADAEKAAASILTPEVAEKSLQEERSMIDFENMNNGADPFNVHGGPKEYYTCLLEEVSVESVVAAFDHWKQFWGDVGDDSAGSYNVLGSWNTKALEKNSENGSIYPWRKRGIFMQATPTYRRQEDYSKAKALGEAAIAAFREEDDSKHRAKAGFVSNLRFGQDIREVWSESAISDIKAAKQTWDEKSVFWSPVQGFDRDL